MEYKVAFLVLLLEMVAGIAVFYYWTRKKTDLPAAKARFAESIKLYREQGDLIQHLQDIVNGKEVIYRKPKSFKIFFKIGIAMILGLGLLIVVARVFEAGLVVRFFVGVLAIFPFIYYTAAAIAEEWDENKITNFEQNTARQMLSIPQDMPEREMIDQLLFEGDSVS